MKINRDNYEAYFLDYHEGQLSPEMVEEVLLFVKENPDLKTLLDEYKAISLVADQDIVFEKKSSIKKNQVFATAHINELNYEEYLLNETEGLLNKDELSAIEEFISINPQFEKERRLYSLAHLSVDDDIVFEAKESLKKKCIPIGAIDAETFETFMAREIEGDLNPDEKLQLAEFMQYNPHFEKGRNIYVHTKLAAKTDIIFEDKNSLKRAAVIPMRRIIYYALSAAATLALIFSVYFLFDRNDIPRTVAQQGKVKNIDKPILIEPSPVLPAKEVALNSIKNSDIVADSNQNKGNIENTISTTDNAINNQGKEILASYDSRQVEILPARQANKVTTRSYVDPQFTFIRISQMYMNQNLEFYYNLKLSQELDYAEMNSKDKNPAKTILGTLVGKAGDLFASNRKTQPKAEQKNITLWAVAELGVKTFNSLTSRDLELNLHKDNEGKVVGYNLESSNIDIERKLKK